jgi:lipoprotein-anchoring transpeptidase ErfK/SrfK
VSVKSYSSGLVTALIAAAAVLSCGPAQAEPLFAFFPPSTQTLIAPQYETIPANQDETNDKLDPRFRRQMVAYSTNEAPGTVVIDTSHTVLYLVLSNGQAIRYGIGVGREGFTWSGVKTIARKAEWPDWYPPQEMVARQPYLPRFTAGGPGNPLGARAMYLGSSEYRIHGTNDPSTIGKQVSSGCIRLTNDDVTDLYERVHVGAKVIVLPQTVHATAPRQQSTISSYAPAPESGAQRTWATIRPSSIY